MLKDTKQTKYCNCSTSCDKNILKPEINHSFCQKCGSILIKDSDQNIYYTLKHKQKIKTIDLNPIDIILCMKKRTEDDYPYLNKEYNMNDIEKGDKESLLKTLNLYLKKRKMVIMTLQKMMKMFDFSDLIFYQCLFYIDNYLSDHISEDMSEKTILYYLVGYFLCSAKFKETDIYEPSLDSFCCLTKNIYLSIEKIAYYEVKCLEYINYNLFCYSAYDWINELASIGFVFDCEVNKNNSIILIKGHRHSILNAINKSIMRMLLSITVKNIFIKYSPMYISFSLIQIGREKYLDKNCIKPKLFECLINLYGINFNDYKKCYKEIKEFIETKEIKNENAESEHKIGSQNEKLKILDTKENISINNNEKIENNSNNKSKFKTNKELPFIDFSENNSKKEENTNNNDKIKDENIIIYDEKNEHEINNNIDLDYKLILDENNETQNKKYNKAYNKMLSFKDTNHIKIKNKHRLSINCRTIVSKSDVNLPKVNPILDKDSNQLKNNKNKNIEHSFINCKSSSPKNIENNSFLKTHINSSNSSKKSKNISNSLDKRHSQNIFLNNSNDTKKEEINLMKKSLFWSKTKNLDNNNQPITINKNFKKMISERPKLKNLNNLIKKEFNYDNIKEEENKFISNIHKEDKNLVKRNKSKTKFKNNLMGKETKIYVKDKRNQSSNCKKRNIKNMPDINLKTKNNGLN